MFSIFTLTFSHWHCAGERRLKDEIKKFIPDVRSSADVPTRVMDDSDLKDEIKNAVLLQVSIERLSGCMFQDEPAVDSLKSQTLRN